MEGFMRKAQVQAISLVLISGIVISLAGAAYFWGRPLIEKRTAITDIASAESFILQLNDEIVDVARNKGEKSLNIPAIPGSSLLVNASGNEIIYSFITSQPMLKLGDKRMPVPIETEHIEVVGTYGESPRIITLESIVYESQYMMTLRLKYRQLNTETIPVKGYKIVLRSAGKTGNNKVSVSYAGTETATIDDAETTITNIDVKIA
ncbi:MAG: hypothetical protein JXC85_03240 [Candidatus Aenigmarchaeota archaeon]|nr:hypothetical protein [Candidatus Aenigmarchaeota archaeon]